MIHYLSFLIDSLTYYSDIYIIKIIKGSMDRQTSINNVNQRYISNAIASGLAPSLNFPGGYPSGFNNDINIPPLTADTDLNAAEGVPISISAAQRSISPYGGLTDRAGHNSRVG